MQENLKKIEEWLILHCDKIATSLNKPASGDQLKKLEDILQKKNTSRF